MEKSRRPRTLVLCAASLAAAGGCKSDPKAELGPKVKGYIAAVADLEACIAPMKDSDFLTAVAFGPAATDGPAREAVDKCQVTFRDRMTGFPTTAKRLGVTVHVTDPDLKDLDEAGKLEMLCAWIGGVHNALGAVAKAAGLPEPTGPNCSLGDPNKRWPPLMEEIGGSVSWNRFAPPEVSLRGSVTTSLADVMAFYRSTEPGSPSLLGTSLDGKKVDTIEVPANVLVVAPAPPPNLGFVELVRPSATGPVELRESDDGKAWRTLATLPARDFTQLHMTKDTVTVVGSPTGQPQLVEVQRSHDGDKTFGAPIRVLDAKQSLWSDVRIERDGAVVALSATESAFSAVRLEPDSKEPSPAVTLPFKEPIKRVALCRGSSSYFVLADKRWLIGSNDAGKTWRDPVDLTKSASPRDLYCVADQVLLVSYLNSGLELVACGPAGCKPPLMIDRSPAQLLFARAIDEGLELWFEHTPTSLTYPANGPLVWVYRLSNGALTPDRIHLLPTQRNHGMRVMMTKLGNPLGSPIGWLDPRSGLGDQPWRNGVETK